jgi:hypothetical protein
MNSTFQSCARCAQPFPLPSLDTALDADHAVCDSCRRFYPPSLLKAAEDCFDYALRLSSGEIIRFHSAKIHGDYVTLYGGDGSYDSQALVDCQQHSSMPFIFDRGLDVRVSDIVWCADAPSGS